LRLLLQFVITISIHQFLSSGLIVLYPAIVPLASVAMTISSIVHSIVNLMEWEARTVVILVSPLAIVDRIDIGEASTKSCDPGLF
jgi:uncharacterized membrane protein (DUF441 family)